MTQKKPIRVLSADTLDRLSSNKNFVALDGETIDNKYVLLATSHPRYCLENKSGITTDEALDFLYRLGHNRHLRKQKTVFVGYFFSYDVEMICRNLPINIKRRLFNPRNILRTSGKDRGKIFKDRVIYKDYELTYIKRKYFSVRKQGENGHFYGITIYDVSGFFTGFPSRSFVKVLEAMRIHVPEEIREGKSGRQHFTFNQYQTIKKYCLLECDKLVELMHAVYAMCESQDLIPKRWYGSSAVGNLALRKWGIRDYMRRTVAEKMSPYFFEAITRAYFGGRIEAFKLGSFNYIYGYDICSAYPDAIRYLPSTRENHFHYTEKYRRGFAVWHVRFKFPQSVDIGVFPFRMQDGSIKFPLQGEGWYWNPEVEVALKHWPTCIEIIEGYYITHSHKPTPFRSLFPMLYKRRLKYKREGNLNYQIIKIVLNSIYGKFAQKVGRADFKNFTWAGWITSYTRARLRDAVVGKEKHIIAFSTDGIYSLKPLRLPLSQNLGGWEKTTFQRGTILMSGVYLLEGEGKPKTGERGYKELSDWNGILEQLNANKRKTLTEKGATVVVRLFVGFNMADNFEDEYGADYLRFTEREKVLNPHMLSKRKYLTRDIDDWTTDHCESLPIGKLSGVSAPIKTEPDFLEDIDLIFTEDGTETIWLLHEA